MAWYVVTVTSSYAGKTYIVITPCQSHLSISLFPIIYFFIFMNLFFSCEGGKGVKKAIQKVASGLVRDAEKSWFAELSDKGKMDDIYHALLLK